ncbi:hypothetical protein BC827DRAFT_1273804 [Russula dissimulans]|nr:hypothetical protein BC827DRAFT_1273804 [Russula dissimulans]
MGQISSRHHRPEEPLSLQPVPSSGQSSSTRIVDSSSLTRSQRLPNSRLHSSHPDSDLSHQSPLPPKRSNRRSFLGSLRSPLRSCLNPQQTPSAQSDVDRPSNSHKRWTLNRRRRKRTELASTLPDYPQFDESQPDEPSHAHMASASASAISPPDATTTNQKGKAKVDRPPPSPTDVPSTVTVGPSSSGSSTMDVSQSDSVPFQSTATDISPPSSSAPSSASSLSPPRGLLTLNHDPAPLPTASIEPDTTPPRTSHNSEAFNVMERPATPPEPSQPPPLPEARRNFPTAGTLVVVQGVVHTSDVSQSTSSEPSETAPRRASSVPPPPPGERASRRRLSDLLVPMRSRRSSYVAPQSQSSESSASVESEIQEESSLISDMPQDSPIQEEPPVPASRPLSLSPTSIEVLGTLLSVATAATAASLVSGSSEPLLNSGLALPFAPGAQGSQQPSQQPTSPPVSDQTQNQNASQGQSRPLSPTPTAGLASRDRVRNAWAGLRDRLGFRPSSPTTTSPVSPIAPSPSPAPPSEPEPAPSTSPVTPVDPRTQLLADMARALGVDDGSGSGSRSAAPSSPAIEVNLGDGQHGQQERPPPPEDSFERFLMDLQVDLRRTLEEGQPDAESEQEQEPEQEQDVEAVGADAPPLVYPREAPLSTHDRQSAPEILDDFGGSLPALPLDDDDLLPNHHHEADASSAVIADDARLEEASATASPSALSPPPSQPQTPTRRTVVGSERRPGGGINWWRMYRFPPMVVSQGTPTTVPSSASPVPPPVTTSPASAEAGTPLGDRGPATPTTATDTQAQAQDGNTVVPVIVVGLQSVHGYGHGHGHRHTEERDERTSQQRRQQESGQDNDHALQDDTLDESAESPHDRERRWSSRATDAFHGLRPVHGSGSTRRERSGSSSSEGDTRAGDDVHGSTTFFIYVIGGYYPPNHQLVIGTDPLDSFEELAELLGQAKPQTASKEDIDNSGLELIRVGMLPEYEKSGRVAPMCVDRCLICLEDYNPEEDLRLLSCRHVFHKECVDRWLETGRNNCPACRSQGVSTSGPVPIPSAA